MARLCYAKETDFNAVPSSGDIYADLQTGGGFVMDLVKKAKAIAGIDGWEPWLFQRIENGILCTGAVCPIKTKGKHKGLPNYAKHDPATKKTIFVGV